MISTKNLTKPTTFNREELVKEMLSYHEPAFHMLSEDKPLFYPKNSFMWNDEMHVSLMKTELTSPVFYTELVDDNYKPADPNRTLYLFRGDSNYVNEYFNKTEQSKVGEYKRYFVPLQEFQKVDLSSFFPEEKTPVYPSKMGPKIEVLFKDEIEIDDERLEDDDALMSKLTIRDHAAIQWKLPVSKKEWLNKLIKKINNV
jgi:hypothetical protein